MPERIECPFCGRKLFDLWSQDVKLDMKYPRCKNIVNIVKTKYMHTEQRSQATI